MGNNLESSMNIGGESLFGFTKDIKGCLCACCCPCIVAYQLDEKAGLAAFSCLPLGCGTAVYPTVALMRGDKFENNDKDEIRTSLYIDCVASAFGCHCLPLSRA